MLSTQLSTDITQPSLEVATLTSVWLMPANAQRERRRYAELGRWRAYQRPNNLVL